MEILASILFSLYLMVSCVEAQTQTVFRAKPGMRINEFRRDGIPRGKLGVVKGIRDCGTGNTSRVLEWRYATCIDTDRLCHVIADGIPRLSQLDFVLTKNINSLGIRWTVRTTDGTITDSIYGGIISNAPVMRRGKVYTITAGGGVTDQLKGKSGIFNYIVYDGVNNNTVICLETLFVFV